VVVQSPIIPQLKLNHPVCASRSLPLLQKEGIFRLTNAFSKKLANHAAAIVATDFQMLAFLRLRMLITALL